MLALALQDVSFSSKPLGKGHTDVTGSCLVFSSEMAFFFFNQLFQPVKSF